jgi:hypothetical protein
MNVPDPQSLGTVETSDAVFPAKGYHKSTLSYLSQPGQLALRPTPLHSAIGENK